MSFLYRKNENIVSRRILDETILVPIRQSAGSQDSIFTLNETAALAWALLDKSGSIEEISAEIARQYEADPAAIQADITDLFENLTEINVLRKEQVD